MAENNQNIQFTSEDESKINKIASRKRGFNVHLTIFILANTLLWVVWFFLFKDKDDQTFFMMILFLLIVWLLALILHYMIAYKWTKLRKEKEIASMKERLLQDIQEIEDLKSQLQSKQQEAFENKDDNTENNNDNQ